MNACVTHCIATLSGPVRAPPCISMSRERGAGHRRVNSHALLLKVLSPMLCRADLILDFRIQIPSTNGTRRAKFPDAGIRGRAPIRQTVAFEYR